jgi:hypothetical protein
LLLLISGVLSLLFAFLELLVFAVKASRKNSRSAEYSCHTPEASF